MFHLIAEKIPERKCLDKPFNLTTGVRYIVYQLKVVILLVPMEIRYPGSAPQTPSAG